MFGSEGDALPALSLNQHQSSAEKLFSSVTTKGAIVCTLIGVCHWVICSL